MLYVTYVDLAALMFYKPNFRIFTPGLNFSLFTESLKSFDAQPVLLVQKKVQLEQSMVQVGINPIVWRNNEL